MKYLTLEDISVSISSGITPSRSNKKFWNNGIYPWLKTEQIGAFEIKETSEHITQEAIDSTSIKIYPKNTISIAMYGEGETRGKVSILKAEMSTNQACCNVIINEKLADYRFVYYWLKNNYLQLRGLSSGVRKNLNTQIISAFQIPNCSIQEQSKKAELLYTLDKKISINNSIISKLEEMAKTIYEYWFLQFDFPNHEGKPYASSGGAMKYSEELGREIPIDWEVKYVKHFCEVQTGSEDANFATPHGRYKFFTCAQETYQCDIPAFEGHAILIAGNGDFNVKHYSGEFNAYQRTYVLLPKKQNYALLYFVVQQRITYFKKGSNGSIVKFIRKADVENIPLPYPKDTKMFDTLNHFILMKEQKMSENQKLAQLRDWLLPMLMNGQARVE